MKNTNVTFKYCGLSKENNFLQAPICECGCGQYANIILETDDDVFSFMYAMLDEHKCNHCAIFSLKNNGYILMGVKLDGEIQCYTAKSNIDGADRWKNIFAEIQQDFEFHCYGLLKQEDEDSYKIVMD